MKSLRNTGKAHLILLTLGALLMVCSLAHASASQQSVSAYQESAIRAFLAQNNITSLDGYITWLKENVVYVKDEGKDIWSAPAETALRKYGDCEDMAFLSAQVLKIFGYEPRVVGYGKGKEVHVICLFEQNGFYYMFDNNRFVRTNAESLEKFAYFFAKVDRSQYFMELDYNPKSIRFLYMMITTPKQA